MSRIAPGDPTIDSTEENIPGDPTSVSGPMEYQATASPPTLTQLGSGNRTVTSTSSGPCRAYSTRPRSSWRTLVCFDIAGQHVGLLPGGRPQQISSPASYSQVDDIETALAAITAAGGSVHEPARDVGGGRTASPADTSMSAVPDVSIGAAIGAEP